MGKLLVTVFANPAPKTNPTKMCTRIRAITRNINPIYLDSFLAPIKPVPRHCAGALIYNSVP
jgi:hypothetical protein